MAIALKGTAAKLILPFAALALASCGSEETETTYEAGVEDVSGGELIVTDPNEPAVEVELPETPMTPVPVDESEPAGAPAPAAE